MGRITGRYFNATNNRVQWRIKSNPTNDSLVATLQDAIDKLAHYEDLEEAGRLIELPCAVGDTVYEVVPLPMFFDELKQTYVIYEKKFKLNDLADFNKWTFLTKEEAEAKLKELEGE